MKLKKPIAKLGRKERNIGKASAGIVKPKATKRKKNMNKEVKNQKPHKLGCVNPCSIAYGYDKNNNVIAQCMDTPNVIAVMVQGNKRIVAVKAFYPMFGTIVYDVKEMRKRYIPADDKDFLSKSIEAK